MCFATTLGGPRSAPALRPGCRVLLTPATKTSHSHSLLPTPGVEPPMCATWVPRMLSCMKTRNAEYAKRAQNLHTL